MKTVKRMLAVFLLILSVTVIGYLVYTGIRLTVINEEEAAEMENTYEEAESS